MQYLGSYLTNIEDFERFEWGKFAQYVNQTYSMMGRDIEPMRETRIQINTISPAADLLIDQLRLFFAEEAYDITAVIVLNGIS